MGNQQPSLYEVEEGSTTIAYSEYTQVSGNRELPITGKRYSLNYNESYRSLSCFYTYVYLDTRFSGSYRYGELET